MSRKHIHSTSDSAMMVSSFLPPVAVLEMTYRCNHSCLFCSCPWFAPEGGFPILDELEIDQWKSVIDSLCREGVTHIAFTGGEPLIKEGITDILSYAASRSIIAIETKKKSLAHVKTVPKLYLLTNGLEMNDSTLELCREFRVKVSFSLPGLRTFRDHTGIDNAKGVLHWLERARALGVRTTAGVTVTRRNLPELFETLSAAFIAGADSLLMNRFLPGGRGLEWIQELFLDISQTRLMMDVAEEVLRRSRRFGSMGTEIPKCILDIGRYSHLRVSTRCSAARDFFVIDPSGYIRVCNHSPVRLSFIDPVESIRNHPYWKTFALKKYLPDACFGCSFSEECDGGCREAAHIVGKEVTSRDPVFSLACPKTEKMV